MNAFSQCVVSDFPPISMPARSVLYRLAPIAAGTARRESLDSYFCRLADAHCLTPQQLAMGVVLPKIDSSTGTRKSILSRNSVWQLSCFNGMGNIASTWVQCLEALTGYSGLAGCTLLSMQDCISRVGLMARKKRWCPECFNIGNGTEGAYGRLIWEIQCVTACPIHETRLVSVCGCSPNERQSPFRRKFLPHICKFCGHTLARGHSCTERATEREIVVARLVARFLSSEAFDSTTTKDYLSKFISGAKDQCAEGKAAWLANILGVNKSAVHGWMNGKHVAEFSRIVSIAYNLGCEISDIFKADSTKLLPLPIPPRARQKETGRVFDRSELDRKLEDFLKQSESLSVKKVASLLGVSPRALYIYSNALAKKISARHGAVLYEQATASMMVKKNIIRAEIRAMLREGIFPTRRRIAERAGTRALTLFRPEDKLLFKQVLSEERARQGAARQKKIENDKASHNEKEP